MNRALSLVGIVITIAVLFSGSYLYLTGEEARSGSQEVVMLNDAGATSNTVSKVVEGNNEFTFDLYQKLVENNDKNVFFSPWSVSTALAMTYEGARENTAQEMRKVLHLPENDKVRRPSFARVHNLLNENKKCELETANGIWAQENYPFLDNYLNVVDNYYGGKITNLDFVNKNEKARKTINDWVSEKTRGKIEELIKKGLLNQFTRLVLTNAIYFKGEWVKQFDKEKTSEETFWTSQNETVKVPMMKMSGENKEFNYTETKNLKALEMPYKGKELSMLVLLPKSKSGLDNIEENISLQQLRQIRENFEKQEVDVHMPRFEFKTKYRLSKTLQKMGMEAAFSSKDANFSGMDGTENLFIHFVVHKAYVKVNEEGTEAAAATGVGVGVTSIPSVKTFHANRPFMVAIQHQGTGNILFMGRVMNPNL